MKKNGLSNNTPFFQAIFVYFSIFNIQYRAIEVLDAKDIRVELQ